MREPDASWREWAPKLERDPQGRGSNRQMDTAAMERCFRDHVAKLYEVNGGVQGGPVGGTVQENYPALTGG